MCLLHRIVQRFRGGLVFKAHRLCVSLNSRRESNKEEEGYVTLKSFLRMVSSTEFRMSETCVLI